ATRTCRLPPSSLHLSPPPPQPAPSPYTTLFRSRHTRRADGTFSSRWHRSRAVLRVARPRSRTSVPGRRITVSQLSADDRLAIHRSEEHTSELQSPDHLVCRLLLEKKKKTTHECD